MSHFISYIRFLLGAKTLTLQAYLYDTFINAMHICLVAVTVCIAVSGVVNAQKAGRAASKGIMSLIEEPIDVTLIPNESVLVPFTAKNSR